MANGQQIDSGQGSVVGGPGAVVSGSEATGDAGSTAGGMILRLHSRKVGGGSAAYSLTGAVQTAGAGAVVATPQYTPLGLASTAALGAFAKTRAVAMTGTALTGSTGTVSSGSGSATTITTIQLTSTAATGTHPYVFGHGFKKGEAVNVATNLPSNEYQVTVKRRWSDGTVKHAIFALSSSFTQNTARTINITNGTAPSGTSLTEANIISAAPTATVTCGSFGSVSLASLLGTSALVRTWNTGPRMVECHYRADVGGGTLLSVWFYVRLWSSGRIWVRAVVENGYLDNGSGAIAANADRSYVPSVVFNGSTVYNNGGAALLHCRNTRWTVEGYFGVDPAITPTYDVVYLRNTKLVPNYGWRNPSAATLNALAQTYTPMGSGNQPTAISGPMHTGGGQAWHGLLPDWAALFCASGDARAYRATLVNSSSINSFPIVLRAKSTNAIATPTAFPTWTADFPSSGNTGGPGGNGIKEVYTSASPQLEWEYHHNPNEGYLAYILTGDMWHLETVGFQAATKYFWLNSNNGSGTARTMTHNETRGWAWCMRDVGCYAGIAPTGDATADDYRTWLQTGGWTYFCSQGPENASLVAPGIGWPATISTYNSGGPLWFSPWQMNYWFATVGFLWDVEPGHSDTTKHQTLRDFMYKGIVGILGTTGSSNYGYIRAGEDSIRVSDTVVADFQYRNASIYYGNWGAVWTNTFGSANTGATSGAALVGDQTSFSPLGRWPIVLPAISYAVDHMATGAQAAWDRLTTASNWTTIANGGLDNAPRMGVKPRNTNEPTYMAGVGTNTWFEIAGTTMAAAVASFPDPLGSTPFGGVRKDNLGSYSGACVEFNGTKVFEGLGGGHTDLNGNQMLSIDFLANTPAYALLRAPTPNAQTSQGVRYYADGRPISRHTYWENWHTPDGRVYAIGCGSMWNDAGGAAPWVDYFDTATNDYGASGHGIPDVPTGIYNPDIPHCQDSTGNIWVHTKDSGTLCRFNYATRTWTTFSATTTSGQFPIVYDPVNNRIVHLAGNGWARAYNAPQGSNTSTTITFSGSQAGIIQSGGFTAVYCPAPVNKILIWRYAVGDTTVYQCDPNTFAVEVYAVAGTPPVKFNPSQGDGAAFNNTYGRFNIIPVLGLIICRSNLPTSTNWKAFRYKLI